MQKKSKNYPDLSLYSNEIEYIFEKFTSFSAFKLYLYLLQKSRFGENPENLAKYSLKRIGEEIGTHRQNVHKSMQVLEEMGLILKKNGFIENIFKISQVAPPDCHTKYDSCNISYDSLSYNLLQSVIDFITKCNISYDKELPNAFTTLAESVSHYSILYSTHYSIHYEGCEFSKFFEKIKSKTKRKENFNKFVSLACIESEERIREVFERVTKTDIHVLGVLDEMIDIIINNKKESIREVKINEILSGAYQKFSDIDHQKLINLNKTEINFLQHYGVHQLSKSDNYEIKKYINDYYQQGEMFC